MTYQEIINAVLPTVVTAAVALLSALAMLWAKRHLSAQDFELLSRFAYTTVSKVEQQFDSTPADQKSGDLKKMVASATLKGMADSYKIKLDAATSDALIEAAVLNLPKFLPPAYGTLLATAPEAPVTVSVDPASVEETPGPDHELATNTK